MTVSFAEGLVGLTLDERYRLDAVLGEGGMGAVFRATHLAMDRRVAVKLLKPHLANDTASLQRFAREARSTMKVNSPHAVKVLDFGVTPERDYYMVLEYLDGRTVQRELDVDGVFTPARVAHITRQALHALGEAHAIGLIHRDIKPANVLLMRAGPDPDFTKLLDFGVAKLMEGAARSDQSQLALTQAGIVFGTPEFMSPEQACGYPLDGRSDLYSLAGTMFAMLTGCGLFEARNAIEWLTNHVTTPPPHLADLRAELVAYPELDELLQRCLAKHRDQRPRTAAELDSLLALIEPKLASREPGVAPSASSKVQVFSSSTLFEALPMELDFPAVSEALPVLLSEPTRGGGDGLPGSPAESTSAIVAHVRPRRTSVYLGIGAFLGLACVSVVIGLALANRSAASERPALDAPAVVHTAEVRDRRVATDAEIDAAHALDAHPPIDAVSVARPAQPATPPKPSRVAEYLRNAEAGFADGNVLKQMSQAKLALELDPRNARAAYLIGDALLKYNDLDRGCAYLRALGRNPQAVARANAGGCP